MARRLADYSWTPIFIGCSSAGVYRLTHPGSPDLCLKIAPSGPKRALAAEKDRLAWLRPHLPVPEVVTYLHQGNREYLLMSAIEGVCACDNSLSDNLPEVVRLLANGLGMFHEIPIAECPFDHRWESMVAQARWRVEHGLVDETDFEPARTGRTARDLFEEIMAIPSEDEDLVVNHGDYCLPNIILRHGALSGFVDLGRAGVGDRYRDLALAERSIARNLGKEWGQPFFAADGIARPDIEKLARYKFLDEFF